MKRLIKTMLADLEAIPGIKKDLGYFFFGVPDQIDNNILTAGGVFIKPRSNTSRPITTGIKEQNDIRLEIIVAKQTKVENYKNAQETPIEFLVRMIENTDEAGSLMTNTIKYTLRKYIRRYGKQQTTMSIDYDSREFSNKGVVTATISLDVTDIYNIQLS